MGVAFQLVMEMLRGGNGQARRLDPSGESSLRLAKRMRLDVMKTRISADRERLAALADEHFGLPEYELPFWETSDAQRPWQDRRRDAGAAGASPETLNE